MVDGWRVLVAGILLSWASACGGVKPTATDAAIDVPSARCDPRASFGAPVALTSLNTDGHDESADLSPDELTLYFSSIRPGGAGSFDIYEATRLSASAPFGNVIPVTGVNTTGADRRPRVTADGLTMFAITCASGAPLYHITLATRGSTTLAFSGLQVIATVNGTTNDEDPYILPSGNVLYFTSDRSGNYGLYRSSKAGSGFSTPTLVSGVNLDSANNESSPVVSPTSSRYSSPGIARAAWVTTISTRRRGRRSPTGLVHRSR
jgi:Tol biopolymer transport system component